MLGDVAGFMPVGDNPSWMAPWKHTPFPGRTYAAARLPSLPSVGNRTTFSMPRVWRRRDGCHRPRGSKSLALARRQRHGLVVQRHQTVYGCACTVVNLISGPVPGSLHVFDPRIPFLHIQLRGQCRSP